MEPTHITGNAVIIIAFLLISILLSTRRIGRYILAGVSVLIGLAGFWFWHHPVALTRIFPFADTIFYANFFPFAVAVFVPPAMGFTKSKGQRIRLGILLAVLFCVSLLPYRYFGLPQAESTENHIDSDGIARQTSISTCGPAAVVTVLAKHGIKTSEAEVASLALTKDRRGTHPLGLYRALRILTRDEPGIRIRLVSISADTLMERNVTAVVTVGLTSQPSTPLEQQLARDLNWDPGSVHDVAFLGTDPEKDDVVMIGEPEFGLERWKKDTFRVLYKGVALTVERKQAGSNL